ncbi:dTDP-4-dehydrorhamnose 3,5-epimerase [Enterobacter sp. 120016]|uniref:dTDP-4-dehydrorhamnose 3,5-epimerase n=1 Tax=Enterobacter sp. 120016 TaxID=2834878 RepID=UPI001BCF637F|nr:dTDP-4-dehydrorhamnose 3,5-epimerase [Enterobacter sp. 120016]MBS7441482.1 dTDP-4-dehydrorhamnose 3,5-epimerase [Enterobacter sp. 120016]
MKIIETPLKDAVIIEPKVFGDERGYFFEVYQKKRYQELGFGLDFVQDNRSKSTKNVLRGLHFQKTKPQGKLVSVTQGSVFDVAVDLRPESPTFGQHHSVILSEDNFLQFYIPPGFAHGFCVLSDTASFQYKCTDYYDPTDEGGLIWNDPELGIEWPVSNPVVSAKDCILPSLESIKEQILKGWTNG